MENKITKEESNIHIENQKNITTKEQNHKNKIQQTQIRENIYQTTNIDNSVSDENVLDEDYVIEFDNIKFAYKEGENDS